MRGLATRLGIVVTGFSTLSLQVISPRLLHPSFGSGTNVTSAVVASSLAGLAVGYALGGRHTSRPERLAGTAMAACGIYIIIVAGLWWSLPSSSGGWLPLIATTIAINALPSLLLGAVSPLAVQALRSKATDFPIATPSYVFGLGTLANVAGGLTSGYFLVPFVGLTRSMTGLALALIGFGGALALLAARQATATEPAATQTQNAETRGEGATAASQRAAGDSSSSLVPGSSWVVGSSSPLTDFPALDLRILAAIGGFASLAIEISATRMFASVVGPTTGLWASILSVSLGGLAIGYFLAGRVRERWLQPALPIVVMANATWLFAAVWLLSTLQPSSSVPMSQILILCAITLLPVFILFGIESQLIVGVLSQSSANAGSEIAATTGSVFAIGALGGVAGALSGTFYLLPQLGISSFVRYMAVVYLLATLLAVRPGRPAVLGFVVVALLAPFPDWIWQDVPGRLVAQQEGRYQTVRIYTDDASYLRFHLGPTYESEVTLPDLHPRFGYANTILSSAGNDLTGRRVLVIGGAGHALSRAFEARGATVVEIEIDPLVIELSDEHFGPIAGMVVHDDGRRFVSQAETESFDIVVIDAFDGPRFVPPHLTTIEFFDEVYRILSDGGTMYMNMIGSTNGAGSASFEALAATVSGAFDGSSNLGNQGNIVLVGGRDSSPDPDRPRLPTLRAANTDELNPMEILLSS